MKNRKPGFTLITSLLLAVLLTSGCTTWLTSPEGQADPTAPASTSAAPTPTAEGGIQPEQALTQTALMNHIIIWLPPQFDPAAGPAGAILQTQLDTFQQSHPDVNIEVRIKDVKSPDGSSPDGMLSVLEKTLELAPAAAPSLVLLPHNHLGAAVRRNLLQTNPRFSLILDDEDWYDYARELAAVQNEYYGIPFAADALILAARTRNGQPSADTWDNLFAAGQPLLFPLSDTQALFSVSLYLSAGGNFLNEQNQSALDVLPLEQVLRFYDTASDDGALLPGIAEYSDYTQTWDAFKQGTADLAVCRISDLLSQTNSGISGWTIPSLGAEPVTLVSGWVWALTELNADKTSLDLELMETLSGADFQTAWTESAGYLPVRPSSLANRDNAAQSMLLSQATISAERQPDSEILGTFGPVFSEAVYNVVIKQMSPGEAARLAIETANPE